MVIHEKWPVEHEAKSLVFDEVAHYLHNLLASRYDILLLRVHAPTNSYARHNILSCRFSRIDGVGGQGAWTGFETESLS